MGREGQGVELLYSQPIFSNGQPRLLSASSIRYAANIIGKFRIGLGSVVVVAMRDSATPYDFHSVVLDRSVVLVGIQIFQVRIFR
jgi:hypothetical protein